MVDLTGWLARPTADRCPIHSHLHPHAAPPQSCITDLRASLIAATAAACVISHVLMGLIGESASCSV